MHRSFFGSKRILILQLVGDPIGKAWGKDSLTELYRREIRKANKAGDAKRAREMNAYVSGTGGGPGLQPLEQTPADDIAPGRVDPRLLTGREPVFDELSLVTVPEASCMSSSQDKTIFGYSCVAPLPSHRGSSSTATSGAYDAQLSFTAAQSTIHSPVVSFAEVPQGLMLDVDVGDGERSWADEILNDSVMSMMSTPSHSPLR